MTCGPRITRAIGALIVLAAAGCLAPDWAAGYQLAVRAEPEQVAADSGGAAIIVEVRTDSGEPAADGTEVQFASTLGTLTPVAQTVNGVARSVLTNSSTGTAQVTVLVGSDRAEVFVEFTSESGKARSESPLVHVSGGYVAYSVDYQVFVVSDRARLEYQGLEIHAESLQFDLGRGLVKAQHQVRVEGSGATLEGERLCYYGNSRSGMLLKVEPDQGVERLFFRGSSLTPEPERPVPRAIFRPIEAQDTRTWIVARDALVFPREKIQFTGSAVYVDDTHLLDLPIYVLRLRGPGGSQGALDQVFRLDSAGGLSIDFPLYYAATQHRAGALHVRRATAGSYSGYAGQGWSLGIVEQYQRGRNFSGTLSLEDVTENTRGFRWDHHHQLGSRARLDLYLNHYRYSPDYPGISTAYGYYYQRMKDAGLTVSMRATRYAESTDTAGDVSYRWGGRQVPKTNIGYDFALEAGYGETPRSGDTPYYVYEPGGREFYYGIDIGLYPPGRDLDERTTLTTAIGIDSDWFLDGGQRDSLGARATVRRNLGRFSNAALTYSYSLRHGDWYDAGRERLALNVYAAKGQTWNLYAYASKNLSGDSMFGSGNFSYQLPFEKLPEGGSKWRLDVLASYSEYASASFTDTRFAVGRDIGAYELLLCYSPQGSGGYGPYGYATATGGRKYWIELGARRW